MPSLNCEGLTRADFDRVQADGLAALMAEILPANRFYARKFAEAGLSPSRLRFPRDLHALPLTTRAELLASQAAHPPAGELLTYPRSRYVRMHQTSGTSTGTPLRWFDTAESWEMILDCWREKFRLGGILPSDTLFFPFTFGPFIGFWSAFEAGVRHGCLCLPGGGMSSTARLRYLLDNAATVVFCTPTYALRLIEVAAAENIPLRDSAVRAVIVAGEPGGSIPATRDRIAQGFGATVFDHNGMTETGPLGFECPGTGGGLTLLETACLPEVIDPDTQEPVPYGTEGELVVTTFLRTGSPLIRYRTGDLVCIDPAPPKEGPPMVRLMGGIRGRADDMIVVRGNNLHPTALQRILHRFAEVSEYLVEIDETQALTALTIHVEIAPHADAQTTLSRISRTIRDELLFRAEVRYALPNTLPRPEMKAKRIRRKAGPPPAGGA